MKKFALLLSVLFVVLGCQEEKEETPETAALAFSEAYCNYNFKRAQKYCTNESRRILLFKASNTTQEELDQNENVTAEVSDVTLSHDSLATVAVHTSNGEDFLLDLVLREGHWLVKAISF